MSSSWAQIITDREWNKDVQLGADSTILRTTRHPTRTTSESRTP
jgi:hypothetical protein